MPLTSVTRLPGGITNQGVDAGLADLRKEFAGVYVTYFDDFIPFTAANYTVTGTGSAAQIAGAAGGQISVISSAGGEQALQPIVFPFTLEATKDFFFQARAMIDDASLSGFFIGISAADISPYASAPTDGLWFRKTAGATGVTATLRAGSVDIATALFVNNPVAGVMYDWSFAYTPQDGVLRAAISGLGAMRLIPSAPLPTVAMAPNISSFGAAARTLACDYIYAAKGR